MITISSRKQKSMMRSQIKLEIAVTISVPENAVVVAVW